MLIFVIIHYIPLKPCINAIKFYIVFLKTIHALKFTFMIFFVIIDVNFCKLEKFGDTCTATKEDSGDS